MIQTVKDFIALLPNWFSSLLVGLILGTLVYLSTNLTWGWHDGIAFVAGYVLNWVTTHLAENPSANPLRINWGQQPQPQPQPKDSEVTK